MEWRGVEANRAHGSQSGIATCSKNALLACEPSALNEGTGQHMRRHQPTRCMGSASAGRHLNRNAAAAEVTSLRVEVPSDGAATRAALAPFSLVSTRRADYRAVLMFNPDP